MKTVALIGTFDSKGAEFAYVKGLIEKLGLKSFTINSGVFEPYFTPDVSNGEVAKAAGYDIKEIVSKKDRALATEALSKGMEKIVPKLYAEGRFDAILSLGGSGGTALAAPAMRALPLGVPKIIVSTMASGNVSQYVGESDLILIPSIVDVAGLNSVSTSVFKNAVALIAGALENSEKLRDETTETKPLVAATMFGVTTPFVNMAKEYLESKGYEVLVFHATGTGGKTMESLVNSGFFKGVLDLTTTEWCDELVGGVLAAGPHRSEAAAKNKVPQVVSVGAMDMVNFGPYDTVPPQFAKRNLYKHNPSVTLMRTTVEENVKLGEKLAEKLNMATEKTALFIPLGGVSMIDAPGQAYYGPEEDKALFEALRKNVNKKVVEVIEMDNNINDKEFALAAAKKLEELMK